MKYSLKDDSTKQLVVDMHQQGISGRRIGLKLGISPRSVQEFLNKDTWKEWWDGNTTKLQYNPDDVSFGREITNKQNIHAKILTIDIETAPLLGACWSLWNNNIGLNQLERDWYILSYSAKWFHEDEVIYKDKSDSWDNEDDQDLLNDIWLLLDEADIVISQNGKKFDEKKINSRFIISGMKPPSYYKSIDTCEIAKRHFGFTSNKLEYLSDKINKRYKKLKHGKFPGYEMWKECLRGNQEAWAEMEEYNIHDVLATEELYTHLRPWYRAHPNLNLYHNENFEYCKCGNDVFEHKGYLVTNLSKFDKFVCASCGAESRGRVNLLTKDKRASLRANIV